MVTDNISDPGVLADLVASNLRLKIEESQAILEIFDPIERLKKVNELLSAGARALNDAGAHPESSQGRDEQDPAGLLTCGSSSSKFNRNWAKATSALKKSTN